MKERIFYLGPTVLLVLVLTGCCKSLGPLTPSTSTTPIINTDLCFVGPNYAAMQIFKVHADGSGLTALTPTSWSVYRPSWNPNKTKIAFGCPSGLPQQGNIYVINADGTGVTVLTDVGGYAPAWSPDGTKIAFITFSEQLWVVNADGTQEHQLNQAVSNVGYLALAWSPDSQKVAYNVTGGTQIMNIEGNIVANIPSVMEYIDWSPDGTQFVYAQYTETIGTLNYWQVFKANTDGSGVTQLTFTPGSHGGPCWSHDGSKIVFTNLDDLLTTPNMCTMNPDGSDIQPLPNASIHYCYQPCWH